MSTDLASRSNSKLVLDLDKGRMTVEDSFVSTKGISTPDEVLARYLAFVYHLRNLPVGAPIYFRDLDLEALSTALEIDKTEIEERLKVLGGNEEIIVKTQKSLRSRMLLPLAGVVLAACSAGLLVFIYNNESEILTDANLKLDVVSDIGSGGAVEFNPDTKR